MFPFISRIWLWAFFRRTLSLRSSSARVEAAFSAVSMRLCRKGERQMLSPTLLLALRSLHLPFVLPSHHSPR